MYQKYTTLGFIVSSRANKEADMLYLCYTREFGMILASATSVRLSKSKLRGKLQTGTLLEITLIKSKSGWRLIEVGETERSLNPRQESYTKFMQTLLVLKSLIHGEEKNESLFDLIHKFYAFLLDTYDTRLLTGAECLAMIGVLGSLGYGLKFGAEEYEGAPFEQVALLKLYDNRNNVIKEINRSLKATGF